MLATVPELAAFTQKALAENDPTATLILDLASAIVEAYAGRNLTRLEGQTLTATVSGRLVFLPSAPVTVTSVTIDDTAVDYEVHEAEGLVVLPSGYSGRRATVEFAAGPAEVPEVAKAVTLAVAARLMTNADGVTQKSIGDVSISYGRAQAGPGLTEWEQQALGPLRFPSVQ